MIKWIKNVFYNVDKVLKGISIFNFIISTLILIIWYFIGILDVEEMAMSELLRIVFGIPVVIGGSLIIGFILSLPLYAFAEILTQLKEINSKMKGDL